MKYFYDTEFFEHGPHQPIRLISIGIVSEDGREYYAQSCTFDWTIVPSGWLRDNVMQNLIRCSSGFDAHDHRIQVHGTCRTSGCPWRKPEAIKSDILDFVGDDRPEWWADFSDYDHVVLSQIFGTMADLPKGWPMWTRDLKQLTVSMGDPKLPQQTSTEHNALADARWTRDAWRWLMERQSRGEGTA